MYPCLFAGCGIDVKAFIRSERPGRGKEIGALFEEALRDKPERYTLKGNNHLMSRIGG